VYSVSNAFGKRVQMILIAMPGSKGDGSSSQIHHHQSAFLSRIKEL